MAYSDTVDLVQGDTLPKLKFTLKDSAEAASGYSLDPDDPTTWAPINLTGATVRLRIREVGSTTVKSTLTMAITSATTGEVETDFPTGTLDTAGVFEAEIEATFVDNSVQSGHELIKLKVREAVG